MNNALIFCLLHVNFYKKPRETECKERPKFCNEIIWFKISNITKSFDWFCSKTIRIFPIEMKKFKLFCHLLPSIFHYIFVLALLLALFIKTREFSHDFRKLLVSSSERLANLDLWAIFHQHNIQQDSFSYWLLKCWKNLVWWHTLNILSLNLNMSVFFLMFNDK